MKVLAYISLLFFLWLGTIESQGFEMVTTSANKSERVIVQHPFLLT